MSESAGAGRAGWGAAAAAVARRPSLWVTAVRQAARLAVPGWWRRRPWFPRPDPAYLRFRLVTAYGDAEQAPRAVDVVSYLRWCRSQPRI